MRAVRYLLVAIMLMVLSGLSTAAQNRVAIPAGLFYYQPASSVFGLEAAWINPAALARSDPAGYQLMADYFDGNIARSWGYVLGYSRSAVAFRYLDIPDRGIFREYIYAGGVQLPGGIETGISYRYFDDGPDYYNNRHLWNIGLGGRTGDALRWGAVFSNLNRGKIGGDRTAVEMRYSLAYRAPSQKYTFAVDMFLSSRNRLAEADYVYHLEANPVPGLFLYGAYDSDKNFSVGFRTNLLKYFAGSRSRFAKGWGGRGTTAYVGATGQRQQSLIKEPRRRLTVGVTGYPRENPPQPVFGRRTTPYPVLLETLHRASIDQSVSEVLIDFNGLRLGLAKAQELRNAIRHLQARGKRVVCYLRGANNLSYYVASAANGIYLPPVSQLRLVGLRAELTFYAGTLDKLGVHLELLRTGEYKTAPDSYTRTSSSPAQREQVNRLLDGMYDQFVRGIAEGRALSADSVRKLIDQGPFTSADAVAAGLIDGLSYRDVLVPDVLHKMPTVSFRRYLADTLVRDSWHRDPLIAVVVAEGDIASQRSRTPFFPSGEVTPPELKGAFAAVVHDPEVAGIVFRVNSPGGYALAGEQIYRSAQRAAGRKPLFVSMANVAASAGYYISMASDRIYAAPATVTGSIGIYGGKADLSGLHEKIGLNKELYTRGRFAGMMSFMRPFTPEEKSKYSSQLNAFYSHFIDLVSDNRSLQPDSVKQLAEGRVWTGEEARANGLIDRIGGLHDALADMAEQLEAADYRIAVYPKKRPLFLLPGGSLLSSLAGLLGLGQGTAREVVEDLTPNEDVSLLARMPYDLHIE